MTVMDGLYYSQASIIITLLRCHCLCLQSQRKMEAWLCKFYIIVALLKLLMVSLSVYH